MSVKSMPMSFVLADSNEKSYLLNVRFFYCFDYFSYMSKSLLY